MAMHLSHTTSSGHIIAFEGVDGSGKSTLVLKAQQMLEERGKTVGVVSASLSPADRSSVSDVDTQLRNLTRDPSCRLDVYAEVCVYLARLREKRNRAIKYVDEKGCDVVLVDRYVYSPYVLANAGRGLAKSTFRTLWSALIEDAWPCLTVICDLDNPNVGIERKREKESLTRTEVEADEFRKNMRDGFRSLPSEFEDQTFVVVNTTHSPLEASFREVWEAVGEHVPALVHGDE